MSETFCTRCQAPVEPYIKGVRPEHPEWCRLCRRRARGRRYRQSEKGRAAEARYQRHYRQTEKYREKEVRFRTSHQRRAWMAQYWRSAKGRTMSRSNALRYARTEQGRAQRARWRQTEQGRALQARWQQSATCRALNRTHCAKRRARARGATILESVDRRRIFELDAGLCHLCDRPVDPQAFHVDHVIPLLVEPIEAEFNCAVTHPACNIRKHARFGEDVLSPTARARWQAGRPAHLAELDTYVARIVAVRSDEEAAA